MVCLGELGLDDEFPMLDNLVSGTGGDKRSNSEADGGPVSLTCLVRIGR